MKHTNFLSSFLALLFSVFVFSAPALAITVDGNVGDWGIAPTSYGDFSQWTPSNGVYFVQEDQNPAVDFLSPGWGGQNFDVEALYFKKESDTAYFLMVAGFPQNGHPGYTGGDFAFDFGSDGSYEYGVDSLTGNLYTNVVWNNPTFAVSGPFEIQSGNLVSLINYAYNGSTFAANKHFIYELGIPISAFGGNWLFENGHPTFTFHWTMSCGNDALDLRLNATPNPEPATLILSLLGFAGTGFSFLRKKS